MPKTGFASSDSIIAYETATIIIMALFTFGRLWQQRRCLARPRDRVPLGKGELFSTIFLVLVTMLTIGQCVYSLIMLKKEVAMGFFKTEDEGAPEDWIQVQWSISKTNAIVSFFPSFLWTVVCIFWSWRFLFACFLTLLQSTFTQLFLHAMSVWLLKACYVSYFHSLAEVLSRKCKAFLYSVSVLVFLGFLGTILICTMWCRPMSSNWYVIFHDSFLGLQD